MNIEIMELEEEHIDKYDVEGFLFKMIKDNYDLDYVPEYHYDVKNLPKYYIEPEKNNFYIVIDTNTDKLIGTTGVRSYDRKNSVKNRQYSKEDTASIYRVFIDENYRHNKIATRLMKCVEEFCKKNYYSQIYLHTQKESYGALPFWLSQDFQIVHDTKDKMGTVHMEKILTEDLLRITTLNDNKEKIEI